MSRQENEWLEPQRLEYMGFSADAREQALTAAARHCCVCHRFRGLKIEVHHIIPKSEGGKDTLENSIALCFDCHSDAGHYNDKHPKGSKLSRSELTRSKAEWHGIVSANKIESPLIGSEHIHFRYFLCSSEYEANRIIRGDFSGFPVKSILVAQNEVYHFWKEIEGETKAYHKSYKSEENDFVDADDYLRHHPDAEMIDKSDSTNPFFTCRRIPTKTELLSGKYNISPINRLMIESTSNPSNYCEIMTYGIECGSGSGEKPYTESLRFRATWFVFLVATNVSTKPVQFDKLQGMTNQKRNVFRAFNDSTEESVYSFTFPKTSIAVGESVTFPVCIVSPPINYRSGQSTQLYSEQIEAGAFRTFGRIDGLDIGHGTFYHLGPYVHPSKLIFNANSTSFDTDVYEFNLERMYTVSTHWEAGSCPHLFFRSAQGKIIYVRGLFTNTPGSIQEEAILVPANIIGITIAELEREVTILETIERNGLAQRSNALTMQQGDTIDIAVLEGDVVRLVGKYESQARSLGIDSVYTRNDLVGQFMSRWYNKQINTTS